MDTYQGGRRAQGTKKIKILWRKTIMKKVLALVLAVMMLATVAMAAPTFDNAIKYKANVTPGASIKVTQDGLEGTGGATVIVTSPKTDDTITYDKDHSGKDSGVFETEKRTVSQYQLDDIIFRAKIGRAHV